MTHDPELPRANVSLRPEDFPLEFEAFDASGARVWHRVVQLLEVRANGFVEMFVPPLKRQFGPVVTRVTYADGRCEETRPDGSHRTLRRGR